MTLWRRGGHAREAFTWALTPWLACEGEAYTNVKWCFEKVARRYGKDSAEFASVWRLSNIGERWASEYVTR
jgi:hypothetical protein